MFIPLYDGNPLRHIKGAWVTWSLIAINILVFLAFQRPIGIQASAVMYGLIPSVVEDIKELPAQFAVLPEDFTYLTYAFLHGDFMHMFGNMLFLWVFGDNIEDELGHIKFLCFYALSAIAGGLAYVLMNPANEVPLVGASGAVAGIVAAYLILHPNVRIWIIAFARIPLKISAMWCLGGWVLLQFINVFALQDSQVAWIAHIGGLAAGAILIVILKRADTPLFDRGRFLSKNNKE